MPLKLLQHKSWRPSLPPSLPLSPLPSFPFPYLPLTLPPSSLADVYSSENIARVRRDEALASATSAVETDRALKAEAEARTERMRAKARKGERKREREGEGEGERELESRRKERKRGEREREEGSRGRDGEEKGKRKEGDREPSNIMTNGHLNFWAELEAVRFPPLPFPPPLCLPFFPSLLTNRLANLRLTGHRHPLLRRPRNPPQESQRRAQPERGRDKGLPRKERRGDAGWMVC